MTRTVTIDVRGTPIPQGSLRLHMLPGGQTAARYPPTVYAWRGQVQQAVADHILEHDLAPIAGPVAVTLFFDLPRPAGHYGTGRNADTVKPSAPGRPAGHPDLDKLCRAILDSITDAGLWKDDAQVCGIHAVKRYAPDDHPPGVTITISEARL